MGQKPVSPAKFGLGSLLVKEMITLGLLFVASILAYSEITPFLFVAVIGSSILYAFRFRKWLNVVPNIGLFLFISMVLLNTELIRTWTALKAQSKAVILPVNWSLIGFVAHGFGIHGGVWDGFQWSHPEKANLFLIGFFLSFIVITTTILGTWLIYNKISNGVLIPTGMMLTTLAVLFIYFRYFVKSPFPVGFGQSWNQFKLSEWSHPFIMVFCMLSVASFQSKLKKNFKKSIILLFISGFLITTVISAVRYRNIIRFYGGCRDLYSFYLKFRQTLITICPPDTRVYLALNGYPNTFFRRMAVYYLPDREVVSDWTDEIYIYPFLPENRKIQTLGLGDCVVEPIGKNWALSQGTTIGPFRIGIFDGKSGPIQIISTIGAHDRENDGDNWWHWIEQKVTFHLKTFFIPEGALRTKLRFEYATRTSQNLTLQIKKHDGTAKYFHMKGDTTNSVFEDILDITPEAIESITIETDEKPSPLSDIDSRSASFKIGNLSITPLQLSP